jgi:hypothetical protein
VLRPDSTVRDPLQFEDILVRPDRTLVVLERRVARGRDVLRLRRLRADGRELRGWGGAFQIRQGATRWRLEAQPDGGLLAYGTSDSGYLTVTSHTVAAARFLPSGGLDRGFGSAGVLRAVPDQNSLEETPQEVSEPQPTLSAWMAAAGERVAYLGSTQATPGDADTPGTRTAILAMLDRTGARDQAFAAGAGSLQLAPPARILETPWAAGVVAQRDGKLLVSMCGTRGGRILGAVARVSAAGALDGSFGSGGWARTQVCGPVATSTGEAALVASGIGTEFLRADGRSLRFAGEPGFAGQADHSCSTCPTATDIAGGLQLVARRMFGVRVEPARPGRARRFVPNPAVLGTVDLRGRRATSARFSPMPTGAQADPFGRASYELLGVASRGRQAWVVGWFRDPERRLGRPFIARFRLVD